MTSTAIPIPSARLRIRMLVRALFGAPRSPLGPWLLAFGLSLLWLSARRWDSGRPLWVHIVNVVGVALCIEGIRALRNKGGGAA